MDLSPALPKILATPLGGAKVKILIALTLYTHYIEQQFINLLHAGKIQNHRETQRVGNDRSHD